MNRPVLYLTIGKLCHWVGRICLFTGIILWALVGWRDVGLPMVVVGVSLTIIRGLFVRLSRG